MNQADVPTVDLHSVDHEVHLLRDPEVNILECEGLPRSVWNKKCVTLYNGNSLLIGEGTCHSVSSNLVAACNGPISDDEVIVFISKSLSLEFIPDGWVYSLRAWPIEFIYYNGVSLSDHEVRDNYNRRQNALRQPHSLNSTRQYASTLRNPRRESCTKSLAVLTQESINLVSSKVCCSRNCVQPFSRDKIQAFRERVFEATFYRYQAYVAHGRQALSHGNLGLTKTMTHIAQATATLKCMLEKSVDHMPHRTRTLKSGDQVVSMILPATFQWNKTIPEINTINASFGLKEVSPSNVSKIRKLNFPEYDAKKPGDNFAWCSTCDKFHELRRGAVSGSQQALVWQNHLKEHLILARAHRELYYANRYRSTSSPHECLTIMHDKMDHAKTASPVFSHKSKELDGLMKLPLSVTGMIAHGDGDVKYTHFGLDLFSHDSNYTIGSFAKLLRDLEQTPKSTSRELFGGSRSSLLFDDVLKGAEICESSLPPFPVTPTMATPLPSILNVQMDNATGDNKNRYVFFFFSLLVAKKIFREIYVNFMLVGHTHDDIDALFGRWSILLRKDNFPTIPKLMNLFMDLESKPIIPHLVEEVPDFKGFIGGSIREGDEALLGHTKAQQFKFYLDSKRCPVMKYKLFCTDVDWLPKEGGGIKLWREDSEGRSLSPCGTPLAVEHRPMRNIEDILKGISGFIKYWENLCYQDLIGKFRRRYEYLVHYWCAVKVALLEPLQTSTVLKNDFWLSTQIETMVADQYEENGAIREEFAEDDTYIGQLRDRPLPSFRVGRDVYEGYFVAIRPADGDTHPIWIARALSDPNCNPDYPNSVFIQYFRPTSRDQDVQQYYTGWDSTRGLRWKVDETQPPLWERTDSLMTSWKSRIKKDTIECMIKIPSTLVEVIHDSLTSYTIIDATQ